MTLDDILAQSLTSSNVSNVYPISALKRRFDFDMD
jgi:hypothetical protein